MRCFEKENKSLKELVHDALMVYLSVVAGDFNQDGFPDLAVGQAALSKVMILRKTRKQQCAFIGKVLTGK